MVNTNNVKCNDYLHYFLCSWIQLHYLDNKTLVTLDTAKYVDYLSSIMFGIDCPSVHHALSRSTNKLNAFSIFRLVIMLLGAVKIYCDWFFASLPPVAVGGDTGEMVYFWYPPTLKDK